MNSRKSSPVRPFLPYGKQSIDDSDIAAVAETLRGDFLTTGPKVGEFEQAFAHQVGAAEAVACANGTAALHLAAMALGLGPGDTVLAPSMSFMASANGPHYTGARIEFMDCDPNAGLVTVDDLREALQRAGGKAKAAVIVHLNGETCDMTALRAETQARGMFLIEDACHALATRYGHSGEPVGNAMAQVGACAHSDMACFSLHPVKTLTTGEGGVVTTNDPKVAARLRRLRAHGIERDAGQFENREMAFAPDGSANPWYHELGQLGFNYRLTDIACALGLSQLRRLEEFAARRRELKAIYDRLFDGFQPKVRAVATRQDCDPCRHLYPVLIDFEGLGTDRATVMRALHGEGIGTQVHYIPVHRQPYYRRLSPDLELPGADAYYRRALSLPFYVGMSDDDPKRVVEALRRVLPGA